MRQSSFILLGLILFGCGGAQPGPASPVESEPQSASGAPAAEGDMSASGGPTDESTGAEPGASEATGADPGDAPGSAGARAPVKILGDGTDEPIGFNKSQTAKDARGVTASKIEPTDTETAMRFFIVDKSKAGAPIEGIVISMTAPDGKKYFTSETDAKGYAEVLVPVGQTYELAYLSLGSRTITAKVPVPNDPQNLKLTLRYERWIAPKPAPGQKAAPGFVLQGVTFDTAKASIRPGSFPRLDSVLEYMTHKPSVRIQISGHTDNVGKPAANKELSRRRAEACRDYLVSKGIDASRIETVGYGDEQPVASNETPQGRQQNRRIEAKEL